MMNDVRVVGLYAGVAKCTSLQELKELRFELSMKAEREAVKLWRLARRAQKHGVSAEVVAAIREEAWHCNTNLRTYPDRMLEWDLQYKMKYAFR